MANYFQAGDRVRIQDDQAARKRPPACGTVQAWTPELALAHPYATGEYHCVRVDGSSSGQRPGSSVFYRVVHASRLTHLDRPKK